MEEPKRIVLILGNGFDLDLGLKTSYKDFWESTFCPKQYPSPLISFLNECWDSELGNVRWYDLENALIDYYQKTLHTPSDVMTSSEARFIETIDPAELWLGHISVAESRTAQSLVTKGLLKIHHSSPHNTYSIPLLDDLRHDCFWRDRKAFQSIKSSLCAYIKQLDYSRINNDSAASMVYHIIAQRKKKGDIVSIYTFNYTEFPKDGDWEYEQITKYVHGRANKGRIIIGTRDDESYNTHYDFLQKAFDPHFYPPALVPDLLEATDVVFFGHSIGENDRQYFKKFFKQKVGDDNHAKINITVFTKDENSELEIKRALQRMTDSNLSVLCSQNSVRIIKTEKLSTERPSDFIWFINEYSLDEAQLVKAFKLINIPFNKTSSLPQ